jgi:hypothetical protein
MAKEKAEAAKSDSKYGIADLVEATGLVAETVRLKLRKLGVKKSGKSYGWNTKDELKSVVDQLKTEAKAEAKPAPKAEKAKPAAKAKAAPKAAAPKKKAA